MALGPLSLSRPWVPVAPCWTPSPHRDGTSWVLGSCYQDFWNWLRSTDPLLGQSLPVSKPYSRTASCFCWSREWAGCAGYRAQSYTDFVWLLPMALADSCLWQHNGSLEQTGNTYTGPSSLHRILRGPKHVPVRARRDQHANPSMPFQGKGTQDSELGATSPAGGRTEEGAPSPGAHSLCAPPASLNNSLSPRDLDLVCVSGGPWKFLGDLSNHQNTGR